MPKGHYERKPRAPEPEIKPAEADAELAAEPFEFTRTPEQARVIAEEQVRYPEAGNVYADHTAPAGAGLGLLASEADAEPITLAIPPHDMVNFKVGMWAGSFCRGEHQVTWRPADDGASLEVTLVTVHGTSTLKATVGNWTEADVDAALAQMRSDLRV